MNQRERMLSGLPYKAWLDGLEEDRQACKQKIYDFNQLPPFRQSKEAPQMNQEIFLEKLAERFPTEREDTGEETAGIVVPFPGRHKKRARHKFLSLYWKNLGRSRHAPFPRRRLTMFSNLWYNTLNYDESF